MCPVLSTIQCYDFFLQMSEHNFISSHFFFQILPTYSVTCYFSHHQISSFHILPPRLTRSFLHHSLTSPSPAPVCTSSPLSPNSVYPYSISPLFHASRSPSSPLPSPSWLPHPPFPSAQRMNIDKHNPEIGESPTIWSRVRHGQVADNNEWSMLLKFLIQTTWHSPQLFITS